MISFKKLKEKEADANLFVNKMKYLVETWKKKEKLFVWFKQQNLCGAYLGVEVNPVSILTCTEH